MIYGAESWVTNTKIESRITATEMKSLRKIAGHTRRDKIRNQTIREDMDITPVTETIETKTLKWFGHVKMKECRLTRRVPEGKKGKGRPRIEWEDHLENISKKRGKT